MVHLQTHQIILSDPMCQAAPTEAQDCKKNENTLTDTSSIYSEDLSTPPPADIREDESLSIKYDAKSWVWVDAFSYYTLKANGGSYRRTGEHCRSRTYPCRWVVPSGTPLSFEYDLRGTIATEVNEVCLQYRALVAEERARVYPELSNGATSHRETASARPASFQPLPTPSLSICSPQSDDLDTVYVNRSFVTYERQTNSCSTKPNLRPTSSIKTLRYQDTATNTPPPSTEWSATQWKPPLSVSENLALLHTPPRQTRSMMSLRHASSSLKRFVSRSTLKAQFTGANDTGNTWVEECRGQSATELKLPIGSSRNCERFSQASTAVVSIPVVVDEVQEEGDEDLFVDNEGVMRYENRVDDVNLALSQSRRLYPWVFDEVQSQRTSMNESQRKVNVAKTSIRRRLGRGLTKLFTKHNAAGDVHPG